MSVRYTQPSTLLPAFEALLREHCATHHGAANKLAKRAKISPVTVCKVRKRTAPEITLATVESILRGMNLRLAIIDEHGTPVATSAQEVPNA